MTPLVYSKNISALITERIASGFVSVTAGGSGDGTLVNGTSFDRTTLNMPRSMVAAIAFTDTLTATKVLQLTKFTIQDSADGSTWADFVDSGAASGTPLVLNTATGTGLTTLNADLTMARRYVRVAFTPDLTASSTDTATLVALAVFGGESPVPAVA